jgi:hypothetical protein
MRNPIMNCDQINKNLLGYIEQSIPTELMEEIGLHVQGCSKCSELLENVAATYTVFDKQLEIQVNPFFYTRLEQKLKNKSLPVQSLLPKVTWKLQPVAASFLVLIGISVGILIGKSASGSDFSLKSPDRSEVLNEYASEYNLISNAEENVSVLMNNE